MLLKIKDFYKTFDKDFFLPKKSFFISLIISAINFSLVRK